jgi:hypothetical protein
LVETRKGILKKAKLALRPMKSFGEPYAWKSRARPAEVEVCPELKKKALD